ncbi:MAG: hypothetical protein ACI4KA_04780 [Oscillospiraceae bacterium]
MKNVDKKLAQQCITGGICALLIGGAAINIGTDSDKEMTISYKQEPTSSQAHQTEPPDIDKAAVTTEAGVLPSPYCSDAEVTVITDIADFTQGDMITVTGVIGSIGENTLTLVDCVILENTEKAAETNGSPEYEPTADTMPESDSAEAGNAVQEYDTRVYVSSSGKYHKSPDCSGMKSSTEMSLDEAITAEYTPCKKCFG